jgi:hypothetical protein
MFEIVHRSSVHTSLHHSSVYTASSCFTVNCACLHYSNNKRKKPSAAGGGRGKKSTTAAAGRGEGQARTSLLLPTSAEAAVEHSMQSTTMRTGAAALQQSACLKQTLTATTNTARHSACHSRMRTSTATMSASMKSTATGSTSSAHRSLRMPTVAVTSTSARSSMTSSTCHLLRTSTIAATNTTTATRHDTTASLSLLIPKCVDVRIVRVDKKPQRNGNLLFPKENVTWYVAEGDIKGLTTSSTVDELCNKITAAMQQQSETDVFLLAQGQLCLPRDIMGAGSWLYFRKVALPHTGYSSSSKSSDDQHFQVEKIAVHGPERANSLSQYISHATAIELRGTPESSMSDADANIEKYVLDIIVTAAVGKLKAAPTAAAGAAQRKSNQNDDEEEEQASKQKSSSSRCACSRCDGSAQYKSPSTCQSNRSKNPQYIAGVPYSKPNHGISGYSLSKGKKRMMTTVAAPSL